MSVYEVHFMNGILEFTQQYATLYMNWTTDRHRRISVFIYWFPYVTNIS